MLLAGISLRREDGAYRVRDSAPVRFDDPAQAIAAVHDHLRELGFERPQTATTENADTEGTRLSFSQGAAGRAMQDLAADPTRFRRGPASESKDFGEIIKQYDLDQEILC